MNSFSAKYTLSGKLPELEAELITMGHGIDLYLETAHNTQLPHYLLDGDGRAAKHPRRPNSRGQDVRGWVSRFENQRKMERNGRRTIVNYNRVSRLSWRSQQRKPSEWKNQSTPKRATYTAWGAREGATRSVFSETQ